jgi:YhcG PDDEXK nuclease domain
MHGEGKSAGSGAERADADTEHHLGEYLTDLAHTFPMSWSHYVRPPVGLILCSEGNAAVAHYALGNLQNNILAAEYRLALPDPKALEAEIRKTRRMLEAPERKRSDPEAGGPQ